MRTDAVGSGNTAAPNGRSEAIADGRVALATLGSWGDVRPFVLLGRALRQEGLRVRLLAHPEWAAVVRKAGLEFTPITDPTAAAEHRALAIELEHQRPDEQFELILRRVFLRQPERQWTRAAKALEDCDLVLVHHLAAVVQAAADERHVPRAGVVLCPGFLPTPVALFRHEAGRERLGGANLRSRLEDTIHGRLRRAHPPADRRALESLLAPTDNLVAASPVLADIDKDPRVPYLLTGAWHVPGPSRLPARLADFLAAGDPPVVFAFGSMGSGQGARLGTECVAAARKVGLRAICQRGAAWLDAGPEGADLFYIEGIDHDRLFPHAACIVHHAGAGTTHAVARSGRPSVAVTHLVDQPYWAEALYRHGSAPPAIKRSELSVDALAEAIQVASREAKMTAAASRLRKKVLEERGIERAVEQVRICLRRSGVEKGGK